MNLSAPYISVLRKLFIAGTGSNSILELKNLQKNQSFPLEVVNSWLNIKCLSDCLDGHGIFEYTNKVTMLILTEDAKLKPALPISVLNPLILGSLSLSSEYFYTNKHVHVYRSS